MSSTRRGFLGKGLAAGMTAAAYQRVMGASDRVGVGFVGYGLIGAQHVYDFKNQRDVDMVAMSDTYQPRMEEGAAACGPNTKTYADFRKLLDDKDVQAVVLSLPDHWHAMAAILACAAGKDVYVEKPMTLFVAEGRWMVKAADKYKRIVQVGTQQRSGRHYQKARELVRSGHIGKVHSVRMASFRNVMPGFGRPDDPTPPADLNYDMWLGPAQAKPYSKHRSLYHFRWFWDFSGGQMTNLGAHQIDIMHWYLGLEAPSAVSSSGGRFALEDDGETPDTQDSVFEFPGRTATWSHREASGGKRGTPILEFCGTKGSLVVDRASYEVFPDLKIDTANAIPRFRGQPNGGPQRTDVKPEPWIEARKETGSGAEQFDLHVRNFLDCVKTRQHPVATVEDGHRVATYCHLANISLRVGRKLRWDPVKEEIPGDREANAMLVRQYRKPWDSILRGLNL